MNALILVVDDTCSLADMVAHALEDEGYRVAVAYDGLAGFETAVRVRPDLVVSDVQMPRLDGPSLLHRLRATGHSMPVVLMGGVSLYRGTAVAYLLPKPFVLEELLAIVRMALQPGASPS